MKMKGKTKDFIRLTLVNILLATMLAVEYQTNVKAASPGALDASFGNAGKTTTDVGGADFVGGFAVQPDGKIVVVGRANLGGGGAAFDFAVVRYNANGTLDTTFDGDGKVTTDFSGQADLGFVAVIQPDRKIVVAGRTAPLGGTTSFALARYNPNGSLDTTFDGDGKVIVDVAAGIPDEAFRIAIQSDAKIVAVGRAGSDWALIRLHLNGALDTTFDGDGKVTTDFGGATDYAFDLAITQEGGIIAGGDGNSNFGLARYNGNGALDPGFGTGGLVTTDFSGAYDRVDSFALQVDGKIVAAGRATVGGDEDTALARYNPGGTLDTTFDGDGKATIDVNPGNPDTGSGVAIQSEGKIVVGGSSNYIGNGDFQVLRFNANGSLDTGFGNGGIVLSDIAGHDIAQASLLHGDKIVLAGIARADGGNSQDFAVARYNLAAAPIQSADFDGDGISDLAVFRPSVGTWYYINSGTNTFTGVQFGANGDVPIDGDFDGDSRNDIAVWRPSNGAWFVLNSSNNLVSGTSFGQLGDKPVAADYDKDGRTDIAVWRPGNGIYYRLNSSNGQFNAAAFGQNGDIPIQSVLNP
jgi:uncharacterized delta-60 repeat protein